MQTKYSETGEVSAIFPASSALQTLALQRKLSIGAVNEPLEYEADAMADKVMRMPKPGLIQRKCSCDQDEQINLKPLAASITPFIQTKGAEGATVNDTFTKQ